MPRHASAPARLPAAPVLAAIRALLPLSVLALFAATACDPARQQSPAPAPAPAPAPTAAPTGLTSNLKSDEDLRLLPAVAVRDGDGWRVDLRAWVFEPEEGSWRRGAAVEALVSALELPPGSEANEVFRKRARAFLVDNESGKRIVVRISSKEHVLEVTGANGHSETTLHLEGADLPAASTPVTAVLQPGDARSFTGTIVRLDAAGISVVSDVDDTIKISEVRDKQRLLERTFLKEFEAVPAMAAAYQRWAAAGAAFHYLSASPWQLYDALLEFTGAAGFPAGSMHLKLFRPKDSSFFSLFQDPREYKAPLLRMLLRGAPGRRFVLVGDSGEMDPEVYGDAYREFPDQVVAIYIRDVTDEGRDAPRYRTAFAGVPEARWQIFVDAAALPPTLP
ncbi:App1 family protein [Nannocystis sp. ILAH1]|uniref:phosphatidate phosphatase App1 family protein n=1 Tax=Nannocystis sp. ILAH1 TaxID=2996789 RepID=UPI00226E9DF8|nr:App1 family protein [Nannocystis sp. ILAH1]MCY0992917.1 App1 family protein [Nannocystis sp. ILAH1]